MTARSRDDDDLEFTSYVWVELECVVIKILVGASV